MVRWLSSGTIAFASAVRRKAAKRSFALQTMVAFNYAAHSWKNVAELLIGEVRCDRRLLPSSTMASQCSASSLCSQWPMLCAWHGAFLRSVAQSNQSTPIGRTHTRARA